MASGLCDRERLLDLRCGDIGRIAALVCVDPARAGADEAHRAAANRADRRRARVDRQQDRQAGGRRRSHMIAGAPNRGTRRSARRERDRLLLTSARRCNGERLLHLRRWGEVDVAALVRIDCASARADESDDTVADRADGVRRGVDGQRNRQTGVYIGASEMRKDGCALGY